MNNWTTLRAAVTFLGLIVMMTVVSATILLMAGKEAPTGLIAIGAGGVGALATLLTGQVSTTTQSHVDDAGQIVTSTKISVDPPIRRPDTAVDIKTAEAVNALHDEVAEVAKLLANGGHPEKLTR